jgi:hypothetical protein
MRADLGGEGRPLLVASYGNVGRRRASSVRKGRSFLVPCQGAAPPGPLVCSALCVAPGIVGRGIVAGGAVGRGESRLTDASEIVAEAATARTEERAFVAGVVSATIFLGFIGYYGLVCIRPDWGGDFQLYCAGIARLYRDLLHPLHEAIDVPSSQSTLYTPGLVGLALIGKLMGVTPFGVLQIAGIFNLVLFAAGACFLFSRVSIHREWWLAAACFLLVTLLLRWHHFGWASELSLTNLQYIQPYAGTFAWGLAFIAFGLLEDLRTRGRWIELVALTAILSLLLSIHMFTASWVIGVTGLFATGVSIRQRSVRPLAWAAAAVSLAFVPALLWPYAPFMDQFGDTPLVRSIRFINSGEPWAKAPLASFPTLYAVGVPCFAYVWWRLRRHGFWFVALVASVAMVLLLRQLGQSQVSRYAALVVFFPQFIVAEVATLGILALLGPLRELPPERRFPSCDRPLSIAVLSVAAFSWLVSPMGAVARRGEGYGRLLSIRALLRRRSAQDAYYHEFSDVATFVNAADVVMMPVSRAVLDFASITGASVVATPLAMRVIDGNERFHAVARFFDKQTDGDARLSIARQYGATKILLPSSAFQLLPALTETFGDPISKGQDRALFSIDR